MSALAISLFAYVFVLGILLVVIVFGRVGKGPMPVAPTPRTKVDPFFSSAFPSVMPSNW